ncbi:MAG TPA: tRNA (adenosine(37)-N6)-threonylcarbamoyltransferase complex dimerization subunit type 1 TsaB [candidate division Zixibacteria bacterium]|nr:tRNA (adenosine(37)-N6)-threonylcarbamoyltransferase complex dimerization subunit type 1 TsaB [candidate division Zixibacteria bacterium]
MIILGIDTCGREGSLALVRSDDNSSEMLEQVSLAGRTYSAQVIPQLAAALERQKLAKDAIDLYAVASGPGSFTGLRVGIATVKALADVFAKPVVEVSVLEAMAYCSTKRAGRVVAVLDAQRAEVYVGEYEVGGNLPKLEREVLMSQAEFVASFSVVPPHSSNRSLNGAPAYVITSDESVFAFLSQAGVASELIERPSAALIAEIGAHKLRAGITVAPELLDANYIRRSDAEIFSAPKLGITTERR